MPRRLHRPSAGKKPVKSSASAFKLKLPDNEEIKRRGQSLEQRNTEIRKRYVNGETQVSLAGEFSLTPSGISLICKGVKQKVKPKRNSRFTERNAEIRRRYAEGETMKALAEEFGFGHENSICSICKGVRKEARAKRDAKIMERYLNGETQTSLAKVFGISPSRVFQICEESIHKKNQRADEIKEAYRRKLGELAEEFGLSQNAISKICKAIERKP